MKANVYNLNLKKTKLHRRLNINYMIYILGNSFSSSYIMYDDTPIKMYKIVHTTGNIHAGMMLLTLELTDVNRPTIPPSNTGIKIKVISLL